MNITCYSRKPFAFIQPSAFLKSVAADQYCFVVGYFSDDGDFSNDHCAPATTTTLMKALSFLIPQGSTISLSS
ncbi:hypothetical protein ACE6H2_007465 [Prunus campanulata]